MIEPDLPNQCQFPDNQLTSAEVPTALRQKETTNQMFTRGFLNSIYLLPAPTIGNHSKEYFNTPRNLKYLYEI